MATRVIYGMARLGDLPGALGVVNSFTATPLAATGLVAATILVLALVAPLERLAELTSLATLLVFAMVNLALLKLRWDGQPTRGPITIPIWIPLLGLASCAAMISFALL